ncbi:hypothetical protein NE659_27575, partial [Flavonifractor plautii]|nr:hypothetical protein [Flavonifractor plautii]
MKQSFYGGVHPNDRKELARHKEVAPLSAAPKQVVIAMAMHVGAPCKPIVAVGDQVKVGCVAELFLLGTLPWFF